MAKDTNGNGGQGVAVDAKGNPVVDPTKNVESLVKALESALDKLRSADAKFSDTIRKDDLRYHEALRHAETKRINELSALRVHYENIIETLRSTSLNNTSQLLATQLNEVKSSLSDRTAGLEQFRWETGGKAGGQSQIIAWITASIMGLIALAGPVIAIIALK